MLIDIYSRGEDKNKYNENIIEVTDELSQLILKIENTLFTRKGSVLGSSDFGCNLEDLIFSLVLNESVIQQKINYQIQSYCIPNNSKFQIESKVSFFVSDDRTGALVDIFINKNRVIGALF